MENVELAYSNLEEVSCPEMKIVQEAIAFYYWYVGEIEQHEAMIKVSQN